MRLPWVPSSRIAVGGGFVWVTEDGGANVLAVSTETRQIARRFQIDASNGIGIAYGDGSLWIAEGDDVARVDPRTGRIVHRIAERPGQKGQTEWLTFADGWLWTASEVGVVRKIDPVANRIVAQTTVQGRISDIAVDHAVWVTITPDDLLDQLNEDDLRLEATTAAGRDPERLSVGGDRVWIANAAGEAVSTVTQATLVQSSRHASAKPQTAVFSGHVLLTAATPRATPLPPIEGEEIRVSTPQQVLFPDPAGPRTPQDKEVAYATCSNLLGYPNSGGAKGGVLRPEVAAAMPTVSLDSRTYTFRIRAGLPLLAAVEPAGHGQDIPLHDRAGVRAAVPRVGQQRRPRHRRAAGVRGRPRQAHRRHRRARESSAHHTDGAGRGVPAADLAARFLPCSDWNSDPPELGGPADRARRAVLRRVDQQRTDCAAPESELRRDATQEAGADRLLDGDPDVGGGEPGRP